MPTLEQLQGNFGTPLNTGPTSPSVASVPFAEPTPSTDWGSLWNTAWNTGYNNYGNTSNPYSGQSGGGYDIGAGYTQGQQAYKANMPSGGTPPPTGGTIISSPQPTQTSGTTNFDSIYSSMYAGWDRTAAEQDWIAKGMPSGGSSGGGSAPDPYAGVKSNINSGYDSYISNLDAQLGQLPGQADAQNQIVNNNFGVGQADLGLQQTQGDQAFAGQRGEVATNQNKNLKSLDENLRNMFMAGNVYLGAKGAGDSSATNQYSYALTKEGNKARGDQMSQATKVYSDIQGRETNLKNIVNNETNRLKAEADNKKLAIGQWFADAQNQIKTAIANGQLSRSTDLANLSKQILDEGIAALRTAQANTQNQQNSLISWAEGNSKTINELKTNLQSVLAVQPNMAAPSGINGTPTVDAQGNMVTNMSGYGYDTKKKTGLFG